VAEGKIQLATVWLCGCAGCHMSLLDLDERLLDLAEVADLTMSPVTDVKNVPEVDLALVEGGVANEDNLRILKEFRRQARVLVSLGDCAGFGCIPMMRNAFPTQDVLDRAYALTESTASGAVPQDEELPRLTEKVEPIHAHVKVDAHIPGCPPSADVIWYAIQELLAGRTPTFENVPMSYT